MYVRPLKFVELPAIPPGKPPGKLKADPLMAALESVAGTAPVFLTKKWVESVLPAATVPKSWVGVPPPRPPPQSSQSARETIALSVDVPDIARETLAVVLEPVRIVRSPACDPAAAGGLYSTCTTQAAPGASEYGAGPQKATGALL